MKLTLRSRIFLVLLIVLSLLTVTAYIIYSRVLLRSFLELENQHVSANIQRVLNALENEEQHLALVVNDRSSWSETYAYVEDHNRDYENDNLSDTTFSINQINLLLLLDNSGQKIWGKAFGEDFTSPINLRPFENDRYPQDFPLFNYRSDPAPLREQKTTGLLMTSAGPMLCAARPILDNNSEGPSHGTLIMGRLLGADLIARIAQLTGVKYEIVPASRATGSTVKHLALTGDDSVSITFSGDETILKASTALRDLYGKPAIEIVAHEKRDILARG